MIDVIFFENQKLTFALSSLAKKSTKNNLSTIRAQQLPSLCFCFLLPKAIPVLPWALLLLPTPTPYRTCCQCGALHGQRCAQQTAPLLGGETVGGRLY